MVTLTDRDKWLCAALPAILTLVVYSWVFARPVWRETAAMRAELRGQEPPAVRAEHLAAAQAESAQLAGDLADLRTAVEGMESPAVTGSQPGTAAQSRADTLRKLSGMCVPAGMTMISARKHAVEGASAGNDIGKLLQQMHWEVAEPWRLELRGPFGGMLRWLDGLAAAGIQALPFGLDMAPGADDVPAASWTVDLWI